MSEKSYVSMEQNVCIICMTKFDTGTLLLDRRMRDSMERYTITDYGLCSKCEEIHEKGYVALIGCDPEKSKGGGDKLKMEEAYRTGEVMHVRRSAALQIFDQDFPDDMPMVFCEQKVIDMLKEKMHPEDKKNAGLL